MHTTLYRKYRPSTFGEMAGQKEIVKTIKNSLKNNTTSHAYLFTGPRGVGKTTIARLIAKGVNCLNPKENGEPCNECKNCLEINQNSYMDMVEIDAASNRGIDEIRELKDKINYAPTNGKKKIYIIDEVHMLTKEAFNALLKTLEEPPSHVIFILATTEVDKILPTIISRCQRYDFKVLSLNEISEKLKEIATDENIILNDDVINVIYENSTGSMRDAISILERLNVSGEDNITLDMAENVLGITPIAQMKIFLDKILEKNYIALVKILDTFWENSIDIENFFKDFAKYCRNKIERQELELKNGLSIIGNIYSILSKFKYEEDKRLVGYVIIDQLIKEQNKNTKTIEVAEKIVKQDNKIQNLDIDFESIKNNWHSIYKKVISQSIGISAFLNSAYPTRLDGDTLYIGFSPDFKFSMVQMQTKKYNNILLLALKDTIHSDIKVKYEIVDKNKATQKITLTERVVDFFGGEIVG